MVLQVRRALEGVVLSIALPAGWLLARFASGAALDGELFTHRDLYLYLFLSGALVLGALGAIAGRREARLIEANARLDTLAVTDPTTGLKNVRYFRARLAEVCARAERDHAPVGLAVIDLDRFKTVNDRFGHPIGDQVLRAAACAIASVCRRGETAARIGGEEFAVIIPGCESQSALNAAERIRRAVETISVAVDGSREPIRITASVGVASTVELGGSDPELLFNAADRALLEAKAQGRNRAVVLPRSAPSFRFAGA